MISFELLLGEIVSQERRNHDALHAKGGVNPYTTSLITILLD